MKMVEIIRYVAKVRLSKGMAFIPFSIPFHSKRLGKFGDRDEKSPKR